MSTDTVYKKLFVDVTKMYNRIKITILMKNTHIFVEADRNLDVSVQELRFLICVLFGNKTIVTLTSQCKAVHN